MKRYRPIIIAPLLLFVVACSSVGETPPQRLFEAQGKMNALLVQARDYVRQPVCTTLVVVGCAKLSVVARLRTIVGNMGLALDTAKAALNGPNADREVSAYAGSVRSLAAVLAAEQVRKMQ